jgi:hypothetical protein
MKAKLEIILKKLEERGQRQPLMPTSIWNRELEEHIRALDWQERNKEPEVIALRAGLHLRNDSLGVSHRYAQQIEYDATGAYWHGVMHRMEGDFSNAKYWFYQAGNHPAMREAAKRIAQSLKQYPDLEQIDPVQFRDRMLDYRNRESWHPSDFTDLVRWQHGRDISDQLRDVLEYIQFLEMDALLSYTLKAIE